MNSVKKILIFAYLFFSFTTITYANCPRNMSNQFAINIAKNAMNTWFIAIQKSDLQTVNRLLSPRFVILHSTGAPLTKNEELKLLAGWQLGGYRFTDFCAMQIDNTIIATFASKTYGRDISKTNISFLSKSKAYRMLIMQKIAGKWLIVAYANTNPVTGKQKQS